MASAKSSLVASSAYSQWISASLLCFFLISLVQAQNQTQEVQILMELKYEEGFSSTGGYWDSWKETDQNACAWVGVTCTTNFTVERLDFSGWGITGMGSVIYNLKPLQDLRQLDLSFNYFGGISPDIGSLMSGITHLDLSWNGFPGSIPPSIFNLTSLRYLNLAQNMLEGEIPSLLGLANIEVLLLGDNDLTGAVPKDLAAITSLVSIDLSGNQLNGTIPSLSNLSNLLELKLDNNMFTELEDPLSPIPKSVEQFSVSGNQIEGMIPPGITNLANLRRLDISRNRFSGNIPPSLSRVSNSNLTFLDMSQNLLTGEIPFDFLLCYPDDSVPVSINLSYNLLNGSVPLLYYSLSGSSMDLSHNQLSGPISFGTGILGNIRISAKFWLQNNRLSGDLADILANLTGQWPSVFFDLRLGNNLFTGDLSRMDWSSFNAIKVLDLSNNNLRMSSTGTIPDPLRATLANLTHNGIVEFRVGGNNFSGTSLPTSYFSDSGGVLNVLDLSNNHLEGQISGDVFNRTWLPTIQTLNLSYNGISGQIPENVIMLPDLTIFDVSNNSLSGPLPPIPQESTLYDQRLFAGNDGLCGAPLPRCVYPLPPQYLPRQSTGVQWWMLLIIVAGSVTIVMGTCLVFSWRWRVYNKRHQQDADLIKTLTERESTTLMSLRVLKKATDSFSDSARIGEGGFGTVYAGKLNNGTIVAVKKSKRVGSDIDKPQFLNEVRILSQVNHPNLVKLLGCCLENKVAALVLEYISNGTLQEHLQGEIGAAPLSWKQRLHIAVQTAVALNYLHSAAIYHRDVKSANILLDDNFNAKVADFGISRLAPVQATHVSTLAVQGTIGYIDPEYYTSLQLTDKSDVYSFGVVLLELISAKPALDTHRGGDETSLVNFASPYIARGDLEGFIDRTLVETFNDPTSHENESILNLGRLAMQCVDMQRKARPNMNEVLKELRNLWLKLNGMSRHLHSVNETSNEDLQYFYEGSFSECNGSDFTIQNDASSIQMSELTVLD